MSIFSVLSFTVCGYYSSRHRGQKGIPCIQHSRALRLTSLAQQKLRKAGERGLSWKFLFPFLYHFAKDGNFSLHLWRPRACTVYAWLTQEGQNHVSWAFCASSSSTRNQGKWKPSLFKRPMERKSMRNGPQSSEPLLEDTGESPSPSNLTKECGSQGSRSYSGFQSPRAGASSLLTSCFVLFLCTPPPLSGPQLLHLKPRASVKLSTMRTTFLTE